MVSYIHYDPTPQWDPTTNDIVICHCQKCGQPTQHKVVGEHGSSVEGSRLWWKSRVGELEAENAELKAEKRRAWQVCGTCEGAQICKQNDELEADNAALKDTVVNLEETLADETAHAASVRIENAALKDQIENVRTNLICEVSDTAALKDTLDTVKRAHTRALHNNAGLQLQAKALKAEVERLLAMTNANPSLFEVARDILVHLHGSGWRATDRTADEYIEYSFNLAERYITECHRREASE
jgi:hypothetical protein